jgi:hypothetical protein
MFSDSEWKKCNAQLWPLQKINCASEALAQEYLAYGCYN